MDTCGIPNKANWYIHVVLGRHNGEFIAGDAITETTYTELYICDSHIPDDLDVVQVGRSFTVTPEQQAEYWHHYDKAIRDLLNWDGHENWQILEAKVVKIR